MIEIEQLEADIADLNIKIKTIDMQLSLDNTLSSQHRRLMLDQLSYMIAYKTKMEKRIDLIRRNKKQLDEQ
jgi:hypothetical protein